MHSTSVAKPAVEDWMTRLHGFEQIGDHHIDELKTRAQLFRHRQTGAQLLSLLNDDENKVFGITFRTPPADSTGVAHILEHSVLCGSRKYPLKEPFVELLKGSLKTFLNAFTYPDKTCYPVASQNVRDFYNLIDVYLDAVFYPRLNPMILRQEGWHYDLEAPDRPLSIKGVVYNEMKGAYSSPDSLLAEWSQQSLFPDTTYGLDSGGNPREIPKLSFDQFAAFHRRYYHPSNARIYFYGDDDPERRLHLVNEYLKDFERLEIDSMVPLQPRFAHPSRITRRFAAGIEQARPSGPGGMFTVNWLLAETTNAELNLALHALEYVLLGMPGSPLRKALIDSGLGEDLAGVGLEAELREMYFSTGLKGIDPHTADQIEALIFRALAELVEHGIESGTVEAAMNTIEFRLRENNTGSFPRGLVLMLRALTTWLYDADPLSMLAFEAPLATVKGRLANREQLFEGLIDRFLINNPHRASLLLYPDTALEERERAEELDQLAAIRGGMSPEQLDQTVRITTELKKIQETPDPPEALANIPRLAIADLARTNKTIPVEEPPQFATRVVYHELFTNQILYLDLGLNLHALPQAHLTYVPLFGRALVELGTDREDFAAFTRRISRKTGGIRPEVFSSAIRGRKDSAPWLFLRGKAMMEQSEELFDILRDMLFAVRFDNRERFRQMVLEEKARQEHKLLPGGHQVLNLRLRAHFSEADWVMEQMHGVSYLMFLRHLAALLDKDWDQVRSTLEDMRRTLLARANAVINVTLDGPNWGRIQPLLQAFAGELPERPVTRAEWHPELPPRFEGLTIPAQINFVGKGANLYDQGYHFHGSSIVVARYLRNSYLWERIRVQGGAYGAFCFFDRMSGNVTFVSYRDPNLLKTLENFDGAGDFLRTAPLTPDELTKAVIGAIGDLDTYLLPDAKGFVSLLRLLTGDSEQDRQRLREEILSTGEAHFRSFGELLAALRERFLVKVLGAEQAVQEALAKKPGWLEVTKVL
jgi:hypothetical protein